MSDMLLRDAGSSRCLGLSALIAPTAIAISLAPPLALAQSSPPYGDYKSGPTRPFDGTPRTGVYSSRPAPRYEQTPQRLGYERREALQPPIWTGIYLGANGGYDWHGASVDGWGTTLAQRSNRIGGHAGYNWQFSKFVVGFEGDMSRARNGLAVVSGASTAFMQQSWQSTLRARAGVTLGPTLLYATGGAAFDNRQVTITSPGPTVSSNSLRMGTAVGAGIEWKFASNVSTRFEALRYDFRDNSLSSTVGTIRQYDNVVRAGLTVHFN